MEAIKISTTAYTIEKSISSRQKVFLAKNPASNEEFIIKVYPHMSNNYQAEKLALETMKNSEVIQAQEIEDTIDFQEDKHSAIVFKYSKNGSLRALMSSQSRAFNYKLAITIFTRVANQVKAMHDKGLAHLDIKFDNVIISEDYLPKVIDFDACQKVTDDKLMTFGTMHSRAPEVIDGSAVDFKAADVFSLGVMLFELVTKIIPYKEGHRFLNYETMFVRDILSYWDMYAERHGKHENKIEWDLRFLLEDMMDKDPKKRPSIDEILRNEHIKKNCLNFSELKDQIESQLKKDEEEEEESY